MPDALQGPRLHSLQTPPGDRWTLHKWYTNISVLMLVSRGHLQISPTNTRQYPHLRIASAQVVSFYAEQHISVVTAINRSVCATQMCRFKSVSFRLAQNCANISNLRCIVRAFSSELFVQSTEVTIIFAPFSKRYDVKLDNQTQLVDVKFLHAPIQPLVTPTVNFVSQSKRQRSLRAKRKLQRNAKNRSSSTTSRKHHSELVSLFPCNLCASRAQNEQKQVMNCVLGMRKPLAFKFLSVFCGR